MRTYADQLLFGPYGADALGHARILDEIEFNLAEGLRQFQPRGIWLDYLTYTGWFEAAAPNLQDSCFCNTCVAEFCETQNLDVDSPAVIMQKHAALWRRHKCEKIAQFAARYAKLIHSSLPGCIVYAYLCPWLPHEYDGGISRIFGQDVDLMADAIDVFTPLIYTAKSGRAYDWGKEYLEKSGDWMPAGKNIQLILDVLDFPQSLEAVASSRIPSWGIQVYSGSSIFSDRSRAEQFRQAVTQIKLAAASAGINGTPAPK